MAVAEHELRTGHVDGAGPSRPQVQIVPVRGLPVVGLIVVGLIVSIAGN
ncbi:MAG: hypothetical protein ACXVZO_10745 [Gaiellaceae bacterium]